MSQQNIQDITQAYLNYVDNTQNTIGSILNLMMNQEEVLARMLSNNTPSLVPSGRGTNLFGNDASISFIVANTLLDNPDLPQTQSLGLSEEAINNSTELVLFETIDAPLNNSCPIAREDFTPTDEVMRITACGHIFTPSHLRAWFRNHRECPMCRHIIEPTTPPPANNTVPQESVRNNISQNIISELFNQLSGSLNTTMPNLTNLNSRSTRTTPHNQGNIEYTVTISDEPATIGSEQRITPRNNTSNRNGNNNL
tara:strand:- start:955 stop:1716 length:762 start_codon:yes stop_codon:yes gene_type:complete